MLDLVVSEELIAEIENLNLIIEGTSYIFEQKCIEFTKGQILYSTVAKEKSEVRYASRLPLS